MVPPTPVPSLREGNRFHDHAIKGLLRQEPEGTFSARNSLTKDDPRMTSARQRNRLPGQQVSTVRLLLTSTNRSKANGRRDVVFTQTKPLTTKEREASARQEGPPSLAPAPALALALAVAVAACVWLLRELTPCA